MQHGNRKEQIENEFLKRLVRKLNQAGCPPSTIGVELIRAELRSAAMVGACEERGRTLAIIRANAHGCSFNQDISSEITSKGVLAVLGYGD